MNYAYENLRDKILYEQILTLRRPKQHRSQAPDVPDLAQTVKPWSGLFKIFTNVFAGAENPKSISIYTSKAVSNAEKNLEMRKMRTISCCNILPEYCH